MFLLEVVTKPKRLCLPLVLTEVYKQKLVRLVGV